MTLTEARRIARIIGSADGGCSTCVDDLAEQLNEAELGFHFEATGNVLYQRSEWEGEREVGPLYVRVTQD